MASLTPAERRVAQLALTQPNLFAEAPIAQLATLANVSQPTVVRFCRSLDCKGLSDFKLRLARSLVVGLPYVHCTVSADDTPPDIAGKVFDNLLSGLYRARNALPPHAVAAAVDVLTDAQRIEFWGLGNSGITAQDAQHKFFRFGVPCVAYADPHVIGMSAALLAPGAVVVAISNSGRTIDLLESVGSARASGARIIGITRPASPLACLCDVLLPADTQEDPDVYSPMIARIVHLALIDVFAVSYAVRGGPTFVERLKRAKRTLAARRLQSHS